jgi:KAT8 regulatory NSL complex subunit 1
MGLRTASVRRPYAEVMAPALTETAQNQAFKLPPKQPASPFKYLPDVPGAFCDLDQDKLAPETLAGTRGCSSDSNKASDSDTIMSESPPLMGDQNTMGLQKTGLDSVSKIHNDKTNEVDQILNNLASNSPDVDIPQNVDEIMQVIKSIESDRQDEDNLTIEKFLTDVDMMNMSMEEQPELETAVLKETQTKEAIAELKTRQNKIERRLAFLRRKIHKMQTRTMGQHVGGEVAGVYEYVHRSLKRLKDNSMQVEEEKPPDKMKPMSCGSTKTMLKKLEMAATLQANSVARQKHLPKYFGSGSCEPGNHRISVPGIVNVPPWPIEHKQELQKVAGLLHTELNVVQHEVDSEATESSSGGESCDEMQNYNNPHQQYLSIQKRALWKYATARAAIACRWTWLQAQISDLEYRIRQHSDLHRQIRSSKGEIRLGGASPPPINNNTSASPTIVNGYRGQLPGSSPISFKTPESETATANGAYPDFQCARTRPLVNFKKRRLLQMNGLHVISKKAARPSTVRCGCVQAPCAICTGRTDPTHPRDPTDALSKAERIALVDPGYHPVFSLPEDVSYAIHCEAIMKNPEWQQRSTRMKSLKILKNDRSDKSVLEHRSKKLDHRKKYNRLLKPSTMSALSAKIRSKMRGRKVGRHGSSSSTFRKKAMAQLQNLVGDGADEEVESIGNNSNAAASNSAVASPSSSPLLHMQAISGYNRRNRANSYDIDNIVIPYSVAASTRVEKLQYKEILTPKWRIADPDFKCDTTNNGAVRNPSQDSDVSISILHR